MSGGTRAGKGDLLVPDVGGTDVIAAYAVLRRAGLNVSIPQGCTLRASSAGNGVVWAQRPRGGEAAGPGATVRIFSSARVGQRPLSPREPTLLPDLTGLPAGQARTLVAGSRLPWTMSLPPSGAMRAPELLENYAIESQWPRAGARLGGGRDRSLWPGAVSLWAQSLVPLGSEVLAGMVLSHPDRSGGEDLELDLEYPSGVPAAFRAAAAVVWAHPAFDDPYLTNQIEPHEQRRVAPDASEVLFGVVTLPGGQRVACSTLWSGGMPPGGLDRPWFNLALDRRSLARAGLDLDQPGTGAWAEPLAAWLTDLARAVHRAAPFLLGLIGPEADVWADLSAARVKRDGVPATRVGHVVLVPEDGEVRAWPATSWR